MAACHRIRQETGIPEHRDLQPCRVLDLAQVEPFNRGLVLVRAAPMPTTGTMAIDNVWCSSACVLLRCSTFVSGVEGLFSFLGRN